MKRSLSNTFSVKQTQRNKARNNNKKTRKEDNKQESKETKNKKQDRERERESEKGKMKEAKEKERETLRNEQKNPFSGENSVIVKNKKHKILRRVEGQQPQNHVQGFFVVPLVSSWSPIVFVYLVHCKSVVHLVFLLLVFCFSSFWWLCFVFCFHVCLYCALCFWFCCFSFLHFLIVWPKNPDQITEYLKCSFWCSVLVPASWQFHLAQLRTPTRTRDENGICFIFMALNNVPKYRFLQWFLNINQNFPQSKWALKKMITFHNVQNQNWCFRNGPLGKMENAQLK